jgi:hypothetical protein
MTLQEIASVRVHDEFQSGSAGEARSRASAASSSNWVEFEDTSALGRFHRMVEIDTIGDANEPDTERSASCVRTEDVAKEANPLCRVQLGRAHFFFPAAHRDRRAAGSAQIAHPLDLAPGSPDPTPASYLNDRQRRGARQATLPAANGDEPIGTHRHASDQKELQDWAEEPDPPWHTCTLRHRDFLNSIAHLRSSFSRRAWSGERASPSGDRHASHRRGRLQARAPSTRMGWRGQRLVLSWSTPCSNVPGSSAHGDSMGELAGRVALAQIALPRGPRMPRAGFRTARRSRRRPDARPPAVRPASP